MLIILRARLSILTLKYCNATKTKPKIPKLYVGRTLRVPQVVAEDEQVYTAEIRSVTRRISSQVPACPVWFPRPHLCRASGSTAFHPLHVHHMVEQ
jgi:hypothetical protein